MIDRESFRKMVEQMLKENAPGADLLLAYADAWDEEVESLGDNYADWELGDGR